MRLTHQLGGVETNSSEMHQLRWNPITGVTMQAEIYAQRVLPRPSTAHAWRQEKDLSYIKTSKLSHSAQSVKTKWTTSWQQGKKPRLLKCRVAPKTCRSTSQRGDRKHTNNSLSFNSLFIRHDTGKTVEMVNRNQMRDSSRKKETLFTAKSGNSLSLQCQKLKTPCKNMRT